MLQKETNALFGGNHPLIEYQGAGFDYFKAFENISKSDVDLIFKCFNFNCEIFSKPVEIIATNSTGWSNFKADTREKRATLYKILADYYVEDHDSVVIKAHPNFDDISSFFPNGVVDNGAYNLELIKHIPNKKIKRVISMRSGVSEKLFGCVDEVIQTGVGFCINYEHVDRIHCALSLSLFLSHFKCGQTFTNDPLFFKSFNRMPHLESVEIVSVAESTCVLGFDYLDNIDKDQITLNPAKKFNHNYSLTICLKTINHSIDEQCNSSTMYLYTNSKEIFLRAKKFIFI